MFGLVTSLLSTVFNIGGDYLKTKQEIKKVKNEGAILIEQTRITAKVRQLESDSQSAGDLDKIALQNVGWKDEYLMIIITIPTILAFIPSMVPYVKLGFTALKEMPEYYQYMLGGVYIYVFGFKRIVLKVINAFIETKFGKTK